MVREKDLTVKDLKEWIKIIREENQKEWKEAEELMKISVELEIERYELSGSTNRPVSLPLHTSTE
jgi:Zn-dependent peptidase ImmA (M78 family)